jgi:Trypsin
MQIVTFYLLLIFSLGSCEFLLDEKFKDAKPAWENPRISNFMQKIVPATFESFDGIVRGGKIIGGTPANFQQFPHQALLFMSQGQGWYLCGGSFVRYNWILTVRF